MHQFDKYKIDNVKLKTGNDSLKHVLLFDLVINVYGDAIALSSASAIVMSISSITGDKKTLSDFVRGVVGGSGRLFCGSDVGLGLIAGDSVLQAGICCCFVFEVFTLIFCCCCTHIMVLFLFCLYCFVTLVFLMWMCFFRFFFIDFVSIKYFSFLMVLGWGILQSLDF